MDGADRFPAHELKRSEEGQIQHLSLSFSTVDFPIPSSSLSSFQLLNNGMMTFDSNFLGGKRVPGPK